MGKGYSFEKEIERWLLKVAEQDESLSPLDRSFRVPCSGAMACMKGDVLTNKVKWLARDITFECKSRKDDSTDKQRKKEGLKSFRLEKEWLDKNREEAEKDGRLSVVCVNFKRTMKNRIHVVVPLDHFEILLNMIKEDNKEPNSSGGEVNVNG